MYTNRKVPWWNSHLRKERKTIRALERRAYSKDFLGPEKAAEKEIADRIYKRQRNKYIKDIRKSKKVSWRNFTEELKGKKDVAKIHKLMSKDHTNAIGNLKKPDGNYTNNAKETMELLTETHFPGRETLNGESYNSVSLINERYDMNSSLFTIGKVKWAK